jgi:hypothetical protein
MGEPEGDEPSDNDEMIAVCMNEHLASAIITMVNRRAVGNAAEEALEYWREKLARLDAMIAGGEDSPYPGIRAAAELRRPDRHHLAVLLRTLGVDVPEKEEGK